MNRGGSSVLAVLKTAIFAPKFSQDPDEFNRAGTRGCENLNVRSVERPEPFTFDIAV